ncbi:MAG: hypothetical protein ACKOPF_01705, partial [Candidatus Limnocylindrus sp.]
MRHLLHQIAEVATPFERGEDVPHARALCELGGLHDVEEHIRTAAPVGSIALSDGYDLGVSPATFRWVLVELEELGLLMQPHTSAGRVPTDL